MENRIILVLIGSLLMAGCAQKVAMNEQPVQEEAPVVAQQEAPAVVEEAPKAEPAPAPVPEPQVQRADDKIFFDFDSYLLTDTSKKVLEDNALWLQTQPGTHVAIEGYADERGSDEYNLALGDKRARAARDYLVNHGIPAGQISVISYGEEKATKGAKSEEVWAQDRRAQVVVNN